MPADQEAHPTFTQLQTSTAQGALLDRHVFAIAAAFKHDKLGVSDGKP